MSFPRFQFALLVFAIACGPSSSDDAGVPDASAVDAPGFDSSTDSSTGVDSSTDSGGVDANGVDASPPCADYAIALTELRAFPSAEGGGSIASGGRGGRVVHVTTLADSGAGSLRAALMETGARTIVFDVSGRIHLEERIELIAENSDFTIAGQTAPEGGITISGRPILLAGG